MSLNSMVKFAVCVREGLETLGLLGWELGEGKVQARSMIFPWHREDKNMRELFDRLCELGVDSIQEEFERLTVN